MSKARKEYAESITAIIKKVRGWYLDDPISEFYRELFDGKGMIDLEWDEANISKDLEWRHTHNLPPGTGDEGKPDRGIGDLLIWHSILAIGERRNHVVFVSADEKKGDWVYYRSEEKLHPRHELVEEFRQRSEGKSFHMVRLNELLELMGVNETTVQEVKSREKEISEFVKRRQETFTTLEEPDAFHDPYDLHGYGTISVHVQRIINRLTSIKSLAHASHGPNTHRVEATPLLDRLKRELMIMRRWIDSPDNLYLPQLPGEASELVEGATEAAKEYLEAIKATENTSLHHRANGDFFYDLCVDIAGRLMNYRG